jgi:hypothetical protein
LPVALVHDVGRTLELGPGLDFRTTEERRLLVHVHLDRRLVVGRAALEPDVRAQLLHAVASQQDARAARRAEAAVLVHANQLGAVAATRSVPEP